jgi:hypothetical protein
MKTLRDGKLFRTKTWEGNKYLIFSNGNGDLDVIIDDRGKNYGAWFSFESFKKTVKLKGLLTMELMPIDRIDVFLSR